MMLNRAITYYYEELLKNDDNKQYQFLYPLYAGNYSHYLNDSEFKQTYIEVDWNKLNNDFQQYINLREEIEVEVSFEDVEPYLNDNTKLLLEQAPNNKYINYEYDNTFENFEYFANYDFLIVGEELLSRLRLVAPNKIKCKIGLYNGNKYPVNLPFIKSYTKNFEIPKLEFTFDFNKVCVNQFITKSYELLRTDDNKLIPAIFGNIPFEYYSHAFKKTKSLFYDLNTQSFVLLESDMQHFDNLIEDFAQNGMLNPLPLGVNSNGKIIDVAQCNSGLMVALYLQLPIIPSILYKNYTDHYTNHIPAIADDTSCLKFANEYCNPYIIFKDSNNVVNDFVVKK